MIVLVLVGNMDDHLLRLPIVHKLDVLGLVQVLVSVVQVLVSIVQVKVVFVVLVPLLCVLVGLVQL